MFLHEVAEGAAGRSWGVHVAELAGVPAPVVRRAAVAAGGTGKAWRPLAAGAPLRHCRCSPPLPPRDRTTAAGRCIAPTRSPRIEPDQIDPARGAGRTVSAESARWPFPARRDLVDHRTAMLTPISHAEARRKRPSPLLSRGAGRAGRGRRAGPARCGARRFPPPSRPHPAPCAARVRAGADHRPAGRAAAGRADRRAWSPRSSSMRPATPTSARRSDLAVAAHRRLRPRRAGAVQRHRPAVPDRRATRTPETLQVVEYMLYFLWDLGLKVGHATRSIEDCLVEGAKDTDDPHRVAGRALPGRRHSSCSATSIARFRAACKEAGAAEYIAAKQAERAVRHRRYGDSPFVVEPNVKEGRGGLRDLQTLYWIARYVFDTQTMGELADLGGILTQHGSAARPPRLGIPVDRAVPSALRRRPRRGTADLRPAAGRRRAHGLYAPRPAGRRRAFHAPLLPHRARDRPPDAHPGAGDPARGARSAGDRGRRPTRRCSSRLRAGRGQAAADAGPRFRCRADPDAAHPAGRARPQPGAASAGRALVHPERAPGGRTARRSEGGRDCSWTCCAARSRDRHRATPRIPMARDGCRS